jgi:hypothetical protein
MKKIIFLSIILAASIVPLSAFEDGRGCVNNCYNKYQNTESQLYNLLQQGIGQCAYSSTQSSCIASKYDTYYYSAGVAIGNMNTCINGCPIE